MKSSRFLFLLLLPLLSAAAPPVAIEKRPVTDTYQGVAVTEDYRWLEAGDAPEVRAWVTAQNERTRAYLDAVPERKALRDRIDAYYKEVSPSYYRLTCRRGAYFSMKFQPPKDQDLLVTFKSPDNPAGERVLVDPNVKNEKGQLAIDWYVPSLDASKVAVAMSEKGSEDATLYFLDAATGKELADRVPRVNYPTGGGSAAWNSDGTGVYYTRYPQGEERPKEDLNFYQQIWFHRLGTPASADTYVLGKEFPRIAETELETRGDGKWLLASVANGDGGEFAHYLMGPEGTWTQLTRFEDKVISAALGVDGAVYLLSRNGAPRGKVLRLPLDAPRLTEAKVVVPEGEAVVEPREALVPMASKLYVQLLSGGPSQAAIYDLKGKLLGQVPLPPVANLQETAALEGDDVLLRTQTYLEPSAWYRFDKGKLARTALVVKAPVRFDDSEVVREFAVSKDGTKIPVNIIRRKDAKLDGKNPTLLTAYGGYGISLKPRFLGITGRLWLDHGGVYAIANLRGGGEYGEAWHKAGMLDNKQTVFDDFIAAAEHLIARKVASPSTLCIEGGSNGGLLMGAALTQRPELFRAVVSHVGIYDMLRVELSPNGAFNVTEFGTVKDPVQFKALYAYSPYHHVQDGAAYPAVLMMTGEHDGRVDPANSRKMTARLQAAGPPRPVLLRTSLDAGHGMGTALSENIEQYADALAFFLNELGSPATPGRR